MSSILSESYTLSVRSSAEFSELWGEGFSEDILFPAECSKVSHSLPDIWLWVSFPSAAGEASLMMTEQGADL